jgi:hypothetical protein
MRAREHLELPGRIMIPNAGIAGDANIREAG